ncbi:uncharacterized protein [Malus domestica]|uniref:uncharacterized protein n=1 Tax=Malus domestica TaxID=3750 RepID=UPI00397482BA
MPFVHTVKLHASPIPFPQWLKKNKLDEKYFKFLEMFKKLEINIPFADAQGEIKPTTISLQMADRSIAYPEGIIKDVLVKVDKLFFPADFLVLDMEEDFETQLILGQPFVITARTLIDVEQRGLTLRIGEEEALLKVFKVEKISKRS